MDGERWKREERVVQVLTMLHRGTRGIGEFKLHVCGWLMLALVARGWAGRETSTYQNIGEGGPGGHMVTAI